MKIKRSDLFNLLAGFEKVKNLEGVKFAYAITKNKKRIQEELQVIQESLSMSEKYKEYDKKRVLLCEKHCDKDEDEKSIITDDKYLGLEKNKKFDKELEELQESYKDTIEKRKKNIDEYNIMLNENIKFDLYEILLTDISDKITVEQFEFIKLIVKK